VSKYSLFNLEKKQQILAKALELFATEGFNPVTTSRLAAAAGVSEGLIFKHFKNKQGLFDQLIQETDQELYQKLGPIISESEPREALRKVILLPAIIDPVDYPHWRFHFKLKWDDSYDALEKIKPLLDKMTWAFSELGYENPEFEAEMLMHYLESVPTSILRDGKPVDPKTIELLLKKYKL